MKKTATVIILTLAVIVAGVVIALKYNSGACDYEYTILSRNYQDCADSSNCTSIYLGYPVFGRKLFNDRAIDSINRHVAIQVTGSAEKTAEDVVSEFFEGYAQYAKDRAEMNAQDSIADGFIPSWTYSSDCSVMVNGPQIIVTEMKFNQYEGGAHGIYANIYTNYDVKSGRALGLTDVFSDTVALARTLTECFIAQKELDASVPLLEQGYFIDNNQLPVTANFALTPDGVIFYYNVYEIAHYAYGPSQVTVPYADLKDIMVYKPDFSGSEVFPVESAS